MKKSAKLELKREAAFLRNDARSRRTAASQLKVLDDRLGKGHGAKRERKRLADSMLGRNG